MPYFSALFRVLGCIGNTTGIWSAIVFSALNMFFSLLGLSVFSALCTVAKQYSFRVNSVSSFSNFHISFESITFATFFKFIDV